MKITDEQIDEFLDDFFSSEEGKELADDVLKKYRDSFFETYTIMDVEGDGVIAVQKGFEEFVENGVIVEDEDIINNIVIVPPSVLDDE